MHWLSLFRLVALGKEHAPSPHNLVYKIPIAWASFCAIVLLGVGAHALSTVNTLRLPSFAWAGLSVATAVLALLTLPAMYATLGHSRGSRPHINISFYRLVIDLLRSGAFTSMIVVDLAWIGAFAPLLLRL